MFRRATVKSAAGIVVLVGTACSGGSGYEPPSGDHLTATQKEELQAYDAGLAWGQKIAEQKGRAPLASDCNLYNTYSDEQIRIGKEGPNGLWPHIQLFLDHEKPFMAGCMDAGGD